MQTPKRRPLPSETAALCLLTALAGCSPSVGSEPGGFGSTGENETDMTEPTGEEPDAEPAADLDEDESMPSCGDDCDLTTDPVQAAFNPRIRGWLTFSPTFFTTEGQAIVSSLGQIPGSNNSYAKMRNLFVCAFEQDYGQDFDSASWSPFAGNDDLLGCDRADGEGYFDITVSGLGEGYGDDVYLVTWFCDAADFDMTTEGGVEYDDEAEVCVRMNVATSSFNSAQGFHRKFLHSRTYSNEFDWYGVNYYNWNLSCPQIDGGTGNLQRITCPVGTEEPVTSGSTNSAVPYNREFVHVFRTAVEPVRSFGSLKPRASAVATQGCGASGLAACPVCSDDACHEELELRVRPATVSGVGAMCSTTGGNTSQGYNNICISHGNNGAWGTLNPFRPIHEIGHNLHRRWMVDPGNVEQETSEGWASASNPGESSATAEGYANFVAVASWYPDSSSNPVYDDLYGDAPGGTVDVESASTASLAGTCGPGTGCGCSEGNLVGNGRPTQFFWDLYDDDDWIDIGFWDILRVWSAFPTGTGNAQSNECGPDGRNLEDFEQRYNQLRSTPAYDHWPSIASMMQANCVDRHRNGSTACN